MCMQSEEFCMVSTGGVASRLLFLLVAVLINPGEQVSLSLQQYRKQVKCCGSSKRVLESHSNRCFCG